MRIQMLRASSVVALCADPLLSARVVMRNRWTWTLTTRAIPHAAFFRAGNNFDEGDYLPDFGDEGDYANDNMDVTEAIPHNIMR